jgi:hypothetical protein
MRLLINHLTRMQTGHICVAGVDLDRSRHVRPVLEAGRLTADFLARNQGPFDMARIVELGPLRACPSRPHLEDHIFNPLAVRVERTAGADEFWTILSRMSRPRLREIFGDALHLLGPSSCGVQPFTGLASLGCLIPAEKPSLWLRADGSIRIDIRDGEFSLNLGVTDLRLYQADHSTPDHALVAAAAEAIVRSRGLILSVGLTRPFMNVNWLQLNNLHLMESPLWPLG